MLSPYSFYLSLFSKAPAERERICLHTVTGFFRNIPIDIGAKWQLEAATWFGKSLVFSMKSPLTVVSLADEVAANPCSYSGY